MKVKKCPATPTAPVSPARWVNWFAPVPATAAVKVGKIGFIPNGAKPKMR